MSEEVLSKYAKSELKVNKNKEEIIEICKEINTHLMNSLGYKIPPAYISFERIIVFRKKVDLLIRFFRSKVNQWDKNTIVIARIGFKRQRSGYGSSLLRFLANIADNRGFKNIGIESANELSANFAKKFGFSNIGGDDWVITTKKLKAYFSEHSP
jgi:hypothetical protein